MLSLGWACLQSMGAALLRSILCLQEGNGVGSEPRGWVRKSPMCAFLNCGPATSLSYWASFCPSWQGSDMIESVITSVGLLPVC